MPLFSRCPPFREVQPDGCTAFIWKLDEQANPAMSGEESTIITLVGPEANLSCAKCEFVLSGEAGSPAVEAQLKGHLVMMVAFVSKIAGLPLEEVAKWDVSRRSSLPAGGNAVAYASRPTKTGFVMTFTISPQPRTEDGK